MVNLAVKIGKLKLKNPVMVASGTFGLEYGELVDINSLGAFVAKTITIKARQGNPPPRVVETASGMLNSIGLENKGFEDFVRNKLPKLAKLKIPLVVSIAGDDEIEFAQLAKSLSKFKNIDALELNLSCPNIKYGSKERLIAQDENSTYKTVAAVRKATGLTIIAKLSPNVTDITKIAKAAEAAGADAVSLVNTFLSLAVDIDARSPILGNITGGLSGPAIKPLAMRMVYETRKKIKIPIIGIGGIADYRDAIEFILSGARAIQVGTANFVDPKAVIGIVAGIKGYLIKNRFKDVGEVEGIL